MRRQAFGTLPALAGLVLLAALLGGCGEDGDEGAVTMTLDASPSIVAVDFSEIGSNEAVYYAGQVYAIRPGTGTIYWSDGSSVWYATVTIAPGTDGDKAPLGGLLLADGNDGRERRYGFYFAPGAYTAGNQLLAARTGVPVRGALPERMRPLQRR